MRMSMVASSSGSAVDRLHFTETAERPLSDEGVPDLRASTYSRVEKSPETSLSNSQRSRESGFVVRLFPTPPHIFGISQTQQLECDNAGQGDTTETLDGSRLRALEAEVLSLSRMLKSLQPLEALPGLPTLALPVDPVSSASSQDRHTEETQQGIEVDGSSVAEEQAGFQSNMGPRLALQPRETFRGFRTSALPLEPVFSVSSQDLHTGETQQGIGVDGSEVADEQPVLRLDTGILALQPLETFPGFPTSALVVVPVSPASSQVRNTEKTQQRTGVDRSGVAKEEEDEEEEEEDLRGHTADTFPGFPTSALAVKPDPPASSQSRYSSQDRDTEETRQRTGVDSSGVAEEEEEEDLRAHTAETFPGFPTSALTVEPDPPASSQSRYLSQDRHTEEAQQGIGVDGSRVAEEQAGIRLDTGRGLAVTDGSDRFGSGGFTNSNLSPPKSPKSRRSYGLSQSPRGSTPSSSIGSASEMQFPSVDLRNTPSLEPLGAQPPGSPLRWRARKSSVSPVVQETNTMDKPQIPFGDIKKKPQANELFALQPEPSDVVQRLKAAYLDVEEAELLSSMIPPGVVALDLNGKDFSIALEYHGPAISHNVPQVEPVHVSTVRTSKVPLPVSKPASPSDNGRPSSSARHRFSVGDLNPVPAWFKRDQRFRDGSKPEVPLMSASSGGRDDPNFVPSSPRSRTASGELERAKHDALRSVLKPDQVETSDSLLTTISHSFRLGKLKWNLHPRS